MGGGIGMGNTCKPMAVLFQCMTKFTTNKKKKKKKRSSLACNYVQTKWNNSYYLFLKEPGLTPRKWE